MTKISLKILLLFLVVAACSKPNPPVLQDLSDRSWTLVDQDSTAVSFPDDFKGDVVVAGYIFTHCQGVCPAITANMKDIAQMLPASKKVQFVGISFDPMRDTPSVLRQYMDKFDLDRDRFTYLTGDSAEVYSLLEQVGIRTRVIGDSAAQQEAGAYAFKHTNQINLIDRQGRIRREYGGSMVPPKNVIEDINRLSN